MKSQKPATTVPERQQQTQLPEEVGNEAMKQIWAEAEKAFNDICGKSLQSGGLKSFDVVKKKIEEGGKASYGLDAGPKDRWDTAKEVGRQTLQYLKILIGAASQVSSFVYGHSEP
jgi:hypothetical protein